MAFDPLSPLDAGFLDVEDDVNQMHIGAVLVLEGPAPSRSELRAMVAGKLPLVPRYRQVAQRVTLHFGRPVWVDDPSFDLDYHLRCVALPNPGSVTELRELVGELMGRGLDPDKPLWEMWMVEGLQDDQWAVLAKVHHSMVDGVGGAELLSLILDLAQDAVPLPGDTWRPAQKPGQRELVMRSVRNAASLPRDAARSAPRAINSLLSSTGRLQETTRSMLSLARVVKPAVSCSLNGPIGPRRRWASTSVPISDIKAVRSSLGGTFNDVVLATVARGFRGLLEKRGELLDQPIRTLVPVSVRGRDESGRAVGDGTLANKVSAVFADLPVQVSDPVARLDAISAQMTPAKRTNEARIAQAFTNLAGFLPPPLVALGSRLFTKVPQHNVNTVTTNIPGPQVPLYAVGRRLLEAYPYVPIAMQVRIGVAMLSYDGQVHFGITGDYEHAPDVEVLAEGIDIGMEEMLAMAEEPATFRPHLSPV